MQSGGMLWKGVWMFIVDITNRGSIPAMESMVTFLEKRHEMLVENVANIDTPHYRTKHLDTEAFQNALADALDRRRRTGSKDFKLSSSEQFEQLSNGSLKVKPTVEPAENLLFHDRTNARIERQMAKLAENAMMHQFMTDRLRGRYESLLTAIRGRLS
jgi:flagellar basal-body rod protein FlgB